MPELKALAREHRLRGYSRLRKAELIELIRNDQHPLQSWEPSIPQRALNRPPRPPPTQTWEPQWEPQTEVRQPELEAPLTKRQLKCRHAKDAKLAKHFVNLNSEINTLKLQMESLKEKISRACRSTHSGFKRKKIRTMKRDVDKISTQLAESEVRLESMTVPKDPISGAPLNRHPQSRHKCIEVKITELNKKIHRAKNGRNRQCLITKRDALQAELN